MFPIWVGFIILLSILAFYLVLSVALAVRLLVEHFYKHTTSSTVEQRREVVPR